MVGLNTLLRIHVDTSRQAHDIELWVTTPNVKIVRLESGALVSNEEIGVTWITQDAPLVENEFLQEPGS
jgi:hypothetical protein